MYDDDHGARLVMLARTMALDQDTAMAQNARDSVTGFSWADRGMGYSLVGPTPPHVLHPVADEVRRQTRREI